MILKLLLRCGDNIVFGDPERCNKLDQKENKLDAADDRESSEKSHGASNEAQLGVKLDLFVSLYLVVGGRVKVDLDQVQGGGRQLFTWIIQRIL